MEKEKPKQMEKGRKASISGFSDHRGLISERKIQIAFQAHVCLDYVLQKTFFGETFSGFSKIDVFMNKLAHIYPLFNNL